MKAREINKWRDSDEEIMDNDKMCMRVQPWEEDDKGKRLKNEVTILFQ